MKTQALLVRNVTYGMFVKRGRAPTADEVAPEVEMSTGEVERVWRELHSMHALLLILVSCVSEGDVGEQAMCPARQVPGPFAHQPE